MSTPPLDLVYARALVVLRIGFRLVAIAISFRQLGERRFARYSLAVILILLLSIGTSLIR